MSKASNKLWKKFEYFVSIMALGWKIFVESGNTSDVGLDPPKRSFETFV